MNEKVHPGFTVDCEWSTAAVDSSTSKKGNFSHGFPMSDLKRPDLTSHYDDVIDSLKRGRLIPFLGAGVNLSGRDPGKAWVAGQALPSGGELALHLAGKASYPQPATPESSEGAAKSKPALDLLQVAQYLSITKDEQKLYDELHDLFDKEYQPSPVHTFFAQLPALLSARRVRKPHQIIVTTNYDDLMERAFEAARPAEAYDLVYYDARLLSQSQAKFLHRPPKGGLNAQPILDPNSFVLPLDEQSVVVKIHGHVARNQDSAEDS